MKGKLIAGGVLALAATVVAGFEGYIPYVYSDPVGIPTACYGHVMTAGDTRKAFTRGECDELLKGDLAIANAVVHSCIKAPMLPHQEAALTSFALNVGGGAKGVKDGLCVLKSGKPTTLRQKANAGDWPGACAELSKWTTAHGIPLRGLVKRRAAERAMCEGR